MKPDMFGSNNTEINHQTVLDHVNPSSMEEHQENSYLHFPDPFDLDDDDLFLSHFLSGQQQLFSGGDCWEEQQQAQEQHGHDETNQNSDKATIDEVKKKKKKICSSNRSSKIGSSTKRTGKKDRHSKICTAQGPRDRRMRLSLQIARKFFDLQDMLGFDKASKTIEWLLSNSNSAIKDLKHNLNNSAHSYGSVCSGSSEVVSEIIRDPNNNNNNNSNAGGGATANEAAFMGTLKDKKSRPLRTVARESRDRARARARQRTILKKTEQQQQQQQPPPISISNSEEDQNSCFNFQHVNSDQLQDQQTHFQDCPNKVFAISDELSDFPSIHCFFSGNINNTQLQNHDHPTFSCPNSIFMASPIPKPYSFSDSTLLKLP